MKTPPGEGLRHHGPDPAAEGGGARASGTTTRSGRAAGTRTASPGEAIPRIARIIAVADTFDAMTTTRPYQKAMPLPYVIERVRSFAGKSFDPAVAAALEKAFASGDLEFLGEEVSMKASA